ncbi:TerB family tellurite resistance protein [Bacteriovorax sp. Seq25_V]|uniref:tellurite resistance TerB family protein n=1 Tax=Bacteriovorax sp. Seq25_V TaxID=1201288 RepID=UPI000389F06E|nr:TerB family tellurite resistance protein [Bacteriovorax sp. Seq25_V]EQC47979.1 tellurite resistance protein TerB [Bacteriovorax sp. Seq25_V]
MGFFDLFIHAEKKEFINKIHQKLSTDFSHLDDNKLVILACLSGLLARVAYVDFNVSDEEKEHIKKSLIECMKLTDPEAEIVTKIAVDEMKELYGLDSRIYCTPLNNILNNDAKYTILELLFAVAASDGNVDNEESNEISYIAKSLLLEKKYFLAAQAGVKDFLGILKKD